MASPPSRSDSAARRAERLAQALRANLGRRKAQQRGRKAAQDPVAGDETAADDAEKTQGPQG